MSDKQPTCKQRIRAHWKSRKADLEVYMKDSEGDEVLGPFSEYGLCFDYVEAGTFNDQNEGYWRYQISWGGPADELRFYGDPTCHIHRVEYWFLDWGDGANLNVTNEGCVQWLIDEFTVCDSFQWALDKLVR